METPTLKLPQSVRPERVNLAQLKANTEPKQSIFNNTEFFAELKKGPEQALKAIKALSPWEKEQFAKEVTKLTGVKVSSRDLGSMLAKDFIPAFQSAFKAAKENPQAVSDNPKEFVRAQIKQLSAAPQDVVERAPVVGIAKPVSKQKPSDRVIAENLATAA